MLQALINLFKIKKQERIEPVLEQPKEKVIEEVSVVEDVKVEVKQTVVDSQITDAVTQAPVKEAKKPKKPRQQKKK